MIIYIRRRVNSLLVNNVAFGPHACLEVNVHDKKSKEHSEECSNRMLKFWQNSNYKKAMSLRISMGVIKARYEKNQKEHAELAQKIHYLKTTSISELSQPDEIDSFKKDSRHIDRFIYRHNQLVEFMHEARLYKAIDAYDKLADKIDNLERRDINTVKYGKVRLRFLEERAKLDEYKAELDKLASHIKEVENEVKSKV